MIEKLIKTLKRGAKVMQVHTHLVLVAILVFVFPLVFLLISQNFFDTAKANIDTAQKQRVGLLHDSIAELIRQDVLTDFDTNSLLRSYSGQNPDIYELLVSQADSEGYRILFSSDETLVGTYDETDLAYANSNPKINEALIFEDYYEGVRQWRVITEISNPNGNYFVISAHNLRAIDSVMTARRQQSYLALTLVFGFLMALAYWMARQIHWRKETERLNEVLEERNMFTNMIAHEFRTPLTAINGYGSFLAESKNLDKDEARYVENIQVSVARLLALVNDFLEVARIQSGKLKLTKTEVDLNSIFAQVVATLEETAKEKGLRLNYTESKLPLVLHTDANRMTQILTNIVSNSIKYTEKGSVTVEAESNPVALIIRVKDTGMGISADDQKKLFSPFTRVGNVDSSKIVGTGLGMWITRQLVEILGGSIGVESIKGVGTHVVLKFKLKKIASEK